MKRVLFVMIAAVLIAAAAVFMFKEGKNEPAVKETLSNPLVTLHTTKGDIKIELFMDKTPITAGNFLKLAAKGFYDGTKFHRVISGFMIQGGDPNTKGDDVSSYGAGGPGYTIEDEFVPGLSNVRGTISMANTGRPQSGGSQFFINLVNNTGLDFDKPPLTSRHPVFGRVVEGMDAVDAIAGVKTNSHDMPLEPVVITGVSNVNPALTPLLYARAGLTAGHCTPRQELTTLR